MSVILRKRKNVDGTTTLRLDIYRNGQRSIETLKNLKLAKPSNLADREENKLLLQQAEAIRVARAAELEASGYSLVADTGKKTVVIAWMEVYAAAYKKKDKRNFQGALNRFKDFLNERKKANLTFGNLDALVIEDFIEYLMENSSGEGAPSYYARFKKMLKSAYRNNMMKDYVLLKVDKKVTGTARKKPILTMEEQLLLSRTPIENTDIKRAFFFCCQTGLRWCDVKSLKWQNIDMANRSMSILQSKTKKEIRNNLNDTAIILLGNEGDPGQLIFKLPTANGANKTLKAWVRRAGIKKAITWHNARHSFGTNLSFNDADILSISQLMGHTSTKHTQRYVDAAKEMKQKATNSINIQYS